MGEAPTCVCNIQHNDVTSIVLVVIFIPIFNVAIELIAESDVP